MEFDTPDNCFSCAGLVGFEFSSDAVSLLRRGVNTFSVQMFDGALAWAVATIDGPQGSQEVVIFDAGASGDAEMRNTNLCELDFDIEGLPHSAEAIVNLGEECDDGNLAAGDGCSSSCRFEGCGNGFVDVGEECDDGNTSSGDGCSSVCAVEQCAFVICEESGDPCNDLRCRPESGLCELDPVADGSQCSDNTVCTLNDSCQAGVCIGGTQLECGGPTNVCEEQPICHEIRGCVFPPKSDGLACNDGSSCTAADQCLGGQCTGFVTTACFDAQVTPIDPTVPTTVGASTAFLHTGPDAVQKDVASRAIEPVRAAVVRGKITTRDGTALPGVTVTGVFVR